MWLTVPGESHSEAYRKGLELLEASFPTYAVSVVESGTPQAFTTSNLRASRATWGNVSNNSGWIYDYGEEDWFTTAQAIGQTKAGITYCNTHNLELAATGFGWCVDYEYHYETFMNNYLNATQEYVDLCVKSGYQTRVFFTTGPVNGTTCASGETGYIKYLSYKIIRDYVNQGKSNILFDYADILCYDDGSETPNTTSWNGHVYPIITAKNQGDGSIGHIGISGALRLGKALWWMLAKMAGWDGSATTGIDDPGDYTSSSAFCEVIENELRIHTDDTWMPARINIYSLNGVVMAVKEYVGNSFRLNISSFPPGIYFVVISKSNSSRTQKIIIS